MQDVLKNNVKLIIGIFIGILISTVSVYAAGELFASNISYDNTTSGLTATDVQRALNELGEKANNWIDSSTIQTNTTGKIFASSKGIIIRRNGGTHFIKTNNFDVEKDHIQQIFSDTSCLVYDDGVNCSAADFYCYVYEYGRLGCDDKSDNLGCYVDGDGSVNCR